MILSKSYGVTGALGVNVPTGDGSGLWSALYYEIVASLDYDAIGLMFMMAGQNSDHKAMRIYAGAAGAEQLIAEVAAPNSVYDAMQMLVPLKVPSGTRISVKTMSNNYQDKCYISCTPIYGASHEMPQVGYGRMYGLGANDFTLVDPGAVAGTKGAWVELAASSTYGAKGLTLFVGSYVGGATAGNFMIDIAVGSAAAEQIIVADLPTRVTAYENNSVCVEHGPFWVPIPAGSRIAVRAACTHATANDRNLYAVITLWE